MQIVFNVRHSRRCDVRGDDLERLVIALRDLAPVNERHEIAVMFELFDEDALQSDGANEVHFAAFAASNAVSKSSSCQSGEFFLARSRATYLVALSTNSAGAPVNRPLGDVRPRLIQ